ncbi:YqgE/AlgH family protein [Tessaracoccus flavus]|uniref:YqgE/AlgH family protein n=1 Tax=Tessaracoccus flavus TaxID=1610493 RepID=UPI00089D3806|nr:YqgE/AlgH family protein [Tessaracoccus flavus]SDY65318.1 putative transcriptional regulator [Tessaracoccus flavus]
MQHTGALAAGQLLVATQPGRGGYFDRSVVLILEHNLEATVGVCLNLPTDTPVADVVAPFADKASVPAVIFEGGPVNNEIAVTLGEPATPESPPPGWQQIVGDIGVVDMSFPPELIDTSFAQLRVFVGLASWAPGQLEAELIRGSWFRSHARPEDVFGDPEGIWRRVLRRMGGGAGRWSTWSDDPTLN